MDGFDCAISCLAHCMLLLGIHLHKETLLIKTLGLGSELSKERADGEKVGAGFFT